ncbi:MAG: hypothetical protein WB699_15290 [Bacteroidota bacterium]
MNSLLRFLRFAPVLVCGLAVAASVLAPPTASGQLINGRFITSFDTWEKFDTIGVSHKVFRGYQSAIFSIGQGNVSVYTNMQAATTLANEITDESDYRLYNLYVKVKEIGGIGDVSFGRVPYFYGVGLGTLDGAVASVHGKANQYKVTLYGGVSTPFDFGISHIGTVKDKFAIGGQVLFNPIAGLRGGLSYMNRRQPLPSYYGVRVDPQTLDAATMLIVPGPEREQLGGVDLSYGCKALSLYGRYDYDFETSKTLRGQIDARYQLNPDVTITLNASRREPHIAAGSFFSQFTLKGVTEVEAGADYFILPGVRTFLRGAYVGYDGDNSFRYSAGIGRNDLQLVVRGNTGYAGELASVSLQGEYPLFDNHVVPNAGLSYMSYKVDAEAPRYTATSAVLGATLRPVSAVSLDLQGQWLNNFIVKSDFRFVGRLYFWFSERLNLFD